MYVKVVIVVTIIVICLNFNCSARLRTSDDCLRPMKKGYGLRQRTRYYYDLNMNSCLEFTYKGRGGSRNRFHSREDCEKVCLPEAINNNTN
uniref:Kunitz-type protease inhibitor 5 II n=1 Tax=Schistosoma japonicum TaxID=6182 RepID=C1LK62_SCHJA|nr:Kunitz-type protease inhibitor 5 II [Schistosoma japonicum]